MKWLLNVLDRFGYTQWFLDRVERVASKRCCGTGWPSLTYEEAELVVLEYEADPIQTRTLIATLEMKINFGKFNGSDLGSVPCSYLSKMLEMLHDSFLKCAVSRVLMSNFVYYQCCRGMQSKTPREILARQHSIMIGFEIVIENLLTSEIERSLDPDDTERVA